MIGILLVMLVLLNLLFSGPNGHIPKLLHPSLIPFPLHLGLNLHIVLKLLRLLMIVPINLGFHFAPYQFASLTLKDFLLNKLLCLFIL